MLGALRSIRAVATAVPAAGPQAETLPARSTARNCAIVSPSAVTGTRPPVAAALQVTPPSVELRDSYRRTPLPPRSVDPAPVSGSEATLCHVSEPPAATGTVGAT